METGDAAGTIAAWCEVALRYSRRQALATILNSFWIFILFLLSCLFVLVGSAPTRAGCMIGRGNRCGVLVMANTRVVARMTVLDSGGVLLD